MKLGEKNAPFTLSRLCNTAGRNDLFSFPRPRKILHFESPFPNRNHSSIAHSTGGALIVFSLIALTCSRSIPYLTASSTLSTVILGMYLGFVPSLKTPVRTRMENHVFSLFWESLNSFVPRMSDSGVSPTKNLLMSISLLRVTGALTLCPGPGRCHGRPSATVVAAELRIRRSQVEAFQTLLS